MSGIGPVISLISSSQRSRNRGISSTMRPLGWGSRCILDLHRLMSLDLAGSGRLDAVLTAKLALVPKGTARSRGWGHLGWKMDAFSIPHDPSVITVDRRYPEFPEEWGTQDRVVPFDIRDIEVYLRIYGSEFDGYPCPIVDFRARARDSELERHLLLKLNGRGFRHGRELRRYHVRIGSSIQ